ncbi:MAG: PaaI family thioesterase [Rhodocyclaceae bacterium]|nr:PaaI family thioesterase [Rhodocyclaceae bacterium]
MNPLLSCKDLQKRIDRSPYHRWLELTVSENTVAGLTLRMPVRPDMFGNTDVGVLHGGIMGSLIDTTACFAVIARTGRTVATVNYSVDFHLATQGPELYARAQVLRLGRSLVSLEVHVRDPKDHIVASGKVLCINSRT